jgi:CarD family transcriptional regulator
VSFATGDTVVHPRHGVATVQGIVSRGSGKNASDYLELFFEARSMTIMVPVDSVEEVGIRRLATKEEADAILELLGEPSDVPEAWSERNASTLSRVQSTELAQASMVIRDLTRHATRSGKRLSAAEGTTLESCLDTVASELSLTLDLPIEETRALILDKVGIPAEDRV